MKIALRCEKNGRKARSPAFRKMERAEKGWGKHHTFQREASEPEGRKSRGIKGGGGAEVGFKGKRKPRSTAEKGFETVWVREGIPQDGPG